MGFDIVYFASVGRNYGGVEQKVIAQFDALAKQRSNVTLYLVCSFSPKGIFAVEIDKRPCVRVLVNKSGKNMNPFYRRKEKFRLISDALRNYDPADTIVYFRYPDADFIFLEFLKKHKGYKIVTEHNEIESTLRKYKNDGSYITKILEAIYGRKVRRRICAYVGVTEEITNFEIVESGEDAKKAMTLGNGIDAQKYPVRVLNKEHPEIIKLLFVGRGYRSHGLDRMLKGMEAYINTGGNPYAIILRIAGESHEMNENKKLASALKIDKYVEFLGNKNPADLDEHFDWADIGVGSLGFHRNGLNYTSNLKAREYFSRGIPFFASTIDEDLVACSEYMLTIDSNDAPVNVEGIISFALAARSDPEHPGKMREYAISNLDWSVKMKKLVVFLESLANNSK